MKSENSEFTLALIKPDAIDKTDEIKDSIENLGFKIWKEKKYLMTISEASEFYDDHRNQPYYDDLIEYMTSGPIAALVLSGDNVIESWKRAIGPSNVIKAKADQPNCLRAKYGTGEYRNAIHGSNDFIKAERELKIIFPEMELQSASGQQAKIYLEENVNPTLLKGLTELCRTKPQQPIIWLADWLLINNPNKSSDATST
ncbi:NME NM23 member 5 [Chamberlinius hualienensis]